MPISADQIDVSYRNPCRLVEESNVADFSAPPTTVDGVATADGDRILCVGQTTTSENGMYTRSGTSWVRSPDMKETIPKGTIVFVLEGELNGGKLYNPGNTDITVGTTAHTWDTVTPPLSWFQLVAQYDEVPELLVTGDTSITLNAETGLGTQATAEIAALAIVYGGYTFASQLDADGSTVTGEVYLYYWKSIKRYRFIPSVDDPLADAFYLNFDGTSLTNKIASQGG